MTATALLGHAYRRLRRVAGVTLESLSYARSFLRLRDSYVEQRWDGQDDLAAARQVAVFVHFDRKGLVHDYVLQYLRALRAAGHVVVFVSNSPRLEEAAVARLRPLCGVVLRRRNVGYDFGAYREGIRQVPDLGRLDRLVVCNDSVYGPFFDLGEVLGRASPESADVWGITDSWQHRYHLQSYFLLFHRAAIGHPAFRRLWDRLRLVQSRGWVIRNHELKFTTTMLQAGLRCRALFPYRSVVEHLVGVMGTRPASVNDLPGPQKGFLMAIYEAALSGRPMNPTHFFWDHLIARMGCPFIKRDLLVHNPMGVPMLHAWDELIRAVSDYDTGLILSHLQQTVRDRSV